MTAHAHRKDDNHKPIAAAYEDAGAWIEDATRDPRRGYDMLVLFGFGTHFVEVKRDPKEKLTPNEQKKRAAIMAHGGHYHIVWDIPSALRAIGAIA